jgi:hypothetical protein
LNLLKFNFRFPASKLHPEIPTVADKFGEIADDIRHARKYARFFG